MIRSNYIKVILCFFVIFQSFGQSKFVLQKGKYEKINFELINNLIVIPVEVNGVELSFLLDTGVSKPIIFNFLNLTEELQINQTERIFLRGLGEGESVEALKSRNNIFKIGNAINVNQDLFAVFDPDMNFAPRLGVPIHGIIGYDLMKDFVIEVNYSKKIMKLYDSKLYEYKKCRRCRTLNLDFFNNKPYIKGDVEIREGRVPVKLLIDSGGSDGLWLFEDDNKGIIIPEKTFDDFLGKGLSGSVYGKRAKVNAFYLDDFKLHDVNVAFPDSTSISYARKFKERSGSLSGEVLKRFNIIYDYGNGKITLKKNRFFSNSFYYNKSGITLEHDGVRVIKTLNKKLDAGSFDSNNSSVSTHGIVLAGSYEYSLAPSFKIVELRIDSPAHKAGLKLGDVILNINNKHAHKYSMQDIMQMFCDKEGKRIKLLLDREGKQIPFTFKLENLL